MKLLREMQGVQYELFDMSAVDEMALAANALSGSNH